MKLGRVLGLVFLLILSLSSLACASQTISPEAINYLKWVVIAAGLGMPIAVLGPAISQGMSVKSACDGISRNPDANGKIITALIIGLAMTESLAIYALVIELILLFANPSLKYVVG